MTIEVPDAFAVRFEAFDAVYGILSAQPTLSTASVATAFRVLAACSGGAWRDPAFMIWAARRNWTSCQQIRDAALGKKQQKEALK